MIVWHVTLVLFFSFAKSDKDKLFFRQKGQKIVIFLIILFLRKGSYKHSKLQNIARFLSFVNEEIKTSSVLKQKKVLKVCNFLELSNTQPKRRHSAVGCDRVHWRVLLESLVSCHIHMNSTRWKSKEPIFNNHCKLGLQRAMRHGKEHHRVQGFLCSFSHPHTYWEKMHAAPGLTVFTYECIEPKGGSRRKKLHHIILTVS